MRDYKAPPVPRSMWENPLHFVAFGFGSGAVPVAPGTFGTLMAIPFYLAMQNLPQMVYLALLLVIIIGSMWLTNKVEKELQVHDHQGMCLDEIVGFLVTMYAAPHGIKWIIIGFLLFRLFDIWKPAPIAYLDKKVKGGIGTILDDVVAGIYSLIVMRILYWMI